MPRTTRRLTGATLTRRANKELKRMLAGTEAKGEPGELWCCLHHKVLFEYTTEPAIERVLFILEHKPGDEIPVRLAEMRPWTGRVPTKLAKADAEREKADAEWEKAYAEREKADAEREKADAEWEKAYAEREKAYAEWEKADAERKKALLTAMPTLTKAHKKLYPDSAWDYKNNVIRGTEGTP